MFLIITDDDSDEQKNNNVMIKPQFLFLNDRDHP